MLLPKEAFALKHVEAHVAINSATPSEAQGLLHQKRSLVKNPTTAAQHLYHPCPNPFPHATRKAYSPSLQNYDGDTYIGK